MTVMVMMMVIVEQEHKPQWLCVKRQGARRARSSGKSYTQGRSYLNKYLVPGVRIVMLTVTGVRGGAMHENRYR